MTRRAGLRLGAAALWAAGLCLSCVSCSGLTTGVRRKEEGLVGYWRFDRRRGRKVRDSSGLGNHGVRVNAKRVEGKVGRALSFEEPRSYVKIPCTKHLALGREMSRTRNPRAPKDSAN